MIYINSKNIKVYPSGYRGLMNIPSRDADDKFSFNPESKLNTEENTVRVYNSLINYENGDFTKSKGSIVITENYKWSTVNKSENNRTFTNFEFISNGYYFKIIDSYQEFNTLISKELLKENPQPIYAEICLNSNGVHELRSNNPSSSSTSEINDLNNIYISGNHLGNLRYVNEDITEGNANDNLSNPTTDYSSLDYYDKTTNTYNFTGLTFVTEINSNDSNVLYFKILEPTEDKTDYVVPLTSKLSVDTKHIKGGNDVNGNDKSLSTYYETETIESYRNKDLNINARIDSIDPNDSASINETADSNINIKAVKQDGNYKATLQLHKDGNKVNIDAVTTDDITLDSKNSNIIVDNKVNIKTDTGSEVSLDSNIVEKTTGNYTVTVGGKSTNTTKGDLSLSVGNTNTSTVNIEQKTGYSEMNITTGLLDVDVVKQFNLNAQEINLTTDNQTTPSDIKLASNKDISLNSANNITVNAINRISIGNRDSELNNIIFNKNVDENDNTESFDIKAKTDKFTIENNANTPTTTVFEGNEITATNGFLKTNDVYIESYKNNNYAVHTDSYGKLISENISNSGISADNRAVYIQKWNQDSKGHVDITTGDLATVAITGQYNDLSGRPDINNGKLTIQKNGTDLGSFTANQSGNTTVNITVPLTLTAKRIQLTATHQSSNSNGGFSHGSLDSAWSENWSDYFDDSDHDGNVWQNSSLTSNTNLALKFGILEFYASDSATDYRYSGDTSVVIGLISGKHNQASCNLLTGSDENTSWVDLKVESSGVYVVFGSSNHSNGSKTDNGSVYLTYYVYE